MVTLLLLVACAGAPADKPSGEDSALPTSTLPDHGPLPDLDNDGYGAATVGGDDCDDTDPTIHPGAVEDCEGEVDRDCDGEAWGGCSEVLPSSDAYVVEAWPVWAVGYPVRDLTGDGVADLVVGGTSSIGVLLGGSLGEAPSVMAHVWEESDGRFEYEMFDAGDVDGDGYNDLVVCDPLYLQALAVEFGPVAVDGETTRLTADATLWTSPPGTYVDWGYQASAGGDLDGDGASEIVVERAIWNGSDYEKYTDVFFGGSRTPRRMSYVEERNGTNPSSMVSDLDGDGLDDLLIEQLGSAAGNTVQWFSGAVLSTNDGARLEDLASGEFAASGSGHLTAIDLDWYSVGDWDGDGYQDVVGESPDSYRVSYAPFPYDDSASGRLVYFGRGLEGDNAPQGSLRISAREQALCTEATPWLREGDSAAGFFCLDLGTDHVDGTRDSFVVLPPKPIRGQVYLADWPHFEVLSQTAAGVALGIPIGGPDVTGDGLGDVGLRGDDGVFLFPGFELPWGDPAAW